MDSLKLGTIKKTLDLLDVKQPAAVIYNEKTDLYNFDYGKIQLQIKNIFETDKDYEYVLTEFLKNIFTDMLYLVDEVVKLESLFDNLQYAKFIESNVTMESIGRLREYVDKLEQYIGVEPTSADEFNDLQIGEEKDKQDG